MFLHLFASAVNSQVFTCMHDIYTNQQLRSSEPESLRNLRDESTSTPESNPNENQFKCNPKLHPATYNLRIDFRMQGIDNEVIKKTFNYVNDFLSKRINVTDRARSLDDDFDLVIDVKAESFEKGSNGLAFARSTYNHPTTGRPTHGEITLNSNKIPFEAQTLESGDRQFILTVIHELNHILSFSSSLFNKWQPYGETATIVHYTDWQGKEISKGEYESYNDNRVPHMYVRSPCLTEWVNNRFKVKNETLINIGLELEDSGGGGTAGSHPNEKLFFTDLMQGRTYGPGWLSPIFYNTLLDTGWYVPSKNLMEDLIYLDDHINTKIHVNESILLKPPQHSIPLPYQCQSTSLQACFYDYTWTGTCSLVQWNDPGKVEPEDMNKKDWYNPNGQSLVGQDNMLDYANLVLPWYSCRSTGDNGLKRMVEFEPDYNYSKYGEAFLPNSTCAMSTLQQGFTGSLLSTSRCYEAWCGTDHRVRLIVNGEEYYCKKDGQQAKFSGFAGSITCPPAAQVCANRKLKEIFGVTSLFPDRGPIDGQNLVAIVGNNYDNYQNVTITLGTVPCEIKVYKDNYILCKLQKPDDNTQKLIREKSNILKQTLDTNTEKNEYRMFKAFYVVKSTNNRTNTTYPDSYYFTKRKYDTGMKD
ncbi:regulation of choline O-acetyltransferase protein [Trichomonas vaginalis G3]|nr:regulation of choline O-acetyltransferase protein [Trichomonas vaginalis G3]XP_001299874.2 regulation of choline O-acetyltransferase protein [Trichomonas vaginalis G3]XP_051101743.1 regulation of choline O-acetyltransferase protein [Trichomonas vaginalis G3]XP_051101749.1 regulation of choline O-acetyltransferase protein [Trichomonas vaginalis G3]XP_051101751.1 regulation of choline O-acetyltransferase protein [Trichomonas vaginalis G3]XP_051101753.1 regulation of choline O-acetyltransferas